MYYKSPTTIISNIGNNSFSFEERKSILGKSEIIIPSIKTIDSIDEVRLGDTVVFEEIDYNGNINSCTGLEHIYTLEKSVIFDNHNHAIYFWSHYAKDHNNISLPVIHIDQHSDLGTPPKSLDPKYNYDLKYMWNYANKVCNVGNFIPPALQGGLISQCEQIRTESSLLGYDNPYKQYILDIDLDFWAPEMSIIEITKTINKTKELMDNASFITIASSPYFLEQTKALQLLKELFQG